MRLCAFILCAFSISIAACNRECERPDRCYEEPDPGPCEAYIPAYYFDEESGKCKELIYGGCEGNVPYETEEECWECECSKQLK